MCHTRKMAGHYRDYLAELRQEFPSPFACDSAGLGGLGLAVAQAFAEFQAPRSNASLVQAQADFDPSSARCLRIADEPQPASRVARQLVAHVSGMLHPANPAGATNLAPPPTNSGVLGYLLAALMNPNLASDEGGAGAAMAEVKAAAMAAALVGYDPETSSGLFTFGGSGTILYGLRMGLEKALPGSMRTGLCQPATIVCSDRAHHACQTAAAWLGIGTDQVVRVPTDACRQIRPCLVETECRDVLRAGLPLAAIVATLGTTDAFGLDDVTALFEIRERLVDEFNLDYRPHLHADAVFGWAFCVFTDYDFEHNPLGFSGATLRALSQIAARLQGLGLADSMGLDFHKTGFTPLPSSLLLTRLATDLTRLSRHRDDIPYLFQTGEYHPGLFTLETTRGGAGPLAALANLLRFGKNGWRAILGHLVHVSQILRDRLAQDPAICLLNSQNAGPVTLFRVYPAGVPAAATLHKERHDPAFRGQFQAYSDYNRRIFEAMHRAARQGGGAAVALTTGSGETDFDEPICALKAYIMTPFADERHVANLVESIATARKAVIDA